MKPLRHVQAALIAALLTVLLHAPASAQAPTHSPARQARTALLVVDAQVGVLRSVWDSKRVIANIEVLVSKARLAGVPVIWVQHSDSELKYGSDDWKLAPNFKIGASDLVVRKTFNSSFANTDLDLKLKQMGVGRLALAGAETSWCIRATAYAAIERGYDLVVVSDAHSTEDLKVSWTKSIPAQGIVDEFNAVMRGIRASGVRVLVTSAKEVEF